MSEFEIKRSSWLRGSGTLEDNIGQDGSYLLRPSDGMKCCLGFYLVACGVPEGEIEGICTPMTVESTIFPARAEWLITAGEAEKTENSPDCVELMQTNDQVGFFCGPAREVQVSDESERERRISRMFAAHGETVRFVD